jgi:hypothetical protein
MAILMGATPIYSRRRVKGKGRFAEVRAQENTPKNRAQVCRAKTEVKFLKIVQRRVKKARMRGHAERRYRAPGFMCGKLIR